MTGNLNYGKTYNYLDTLKRRGYKPRRVWGLQLTKVSTSDFNIGNFLMRSGAVTNRTYRVGSPENVIKNGKLNRPTQGVIKRKDTGALTSAPTN